MMDADLQPTYVNTLVVTAKLDPQYKRQTKDRSLVVVVLYPCANMNRPALIQDVIRQLSESNPWFTDFKCVFEEPIVAGLMATGPECLRILRDYGFAVVSQHNKH